MEIVFEWRSKCPFNLQSSSRSHLFITKLWKYSPMFLVSFEWFDWGVPQKCGLLFDINFCIEAFNLSIWPLHWLLENYQLRLKIEYNLQLPKTPQVHKHRLIRLLLLHTFAFTSYIYAYCIMHAITIVVKKSIVFFLSRTLKQAKP